MLRIFLVVNLFIFISVFSIYPAGAESVSDYMVDNLLQGKRQVQESAAKEMLATIAAAAETYKTANGEYPESLEVLAQTKPPYIDPAVAKGEVQGYVFEYGVGVNRDKFSCVARPYVEKFNLKKFMIDHEGNISEFGN